MAEMKDVVDEWIRVAMEHLGQDYAQCSPWMKENYPGTVSPWCACFVCACAGALGILGEVIYPSAHAETLVKKTASECGGVLHDNPAGYNPVKGDLIWWNRNGGHVSFVIEDYDGSGILHTIDGNTSNMVKTRDQGYPAAAGVLTTPDWSKATGYYHTSSSGLGSSNIRLLYDTLPTRADATIREVGMVTPDMQPTPFPSGYHLATANYTQMLYDLWEIYSGNSIDSITSYDTSALPEKERIFIDYFIGKGLNAAAACGIAGSVDYYSGFDTTRSFMGVRFGLGMWMGKRFEGLKDVAGELWPFNYSGQIEFIWVELSIDYKNTILQALEHVNNDEQGVNDAAFEMFSKYFDLDILLPNRSHPDYQQIAERGRNWFNQIKIHTGGPAMIIDLSGGQTIDIPDGLGGVFTITQYGVPGWFMNGKWTKISTGTGQERVHDAWLAAGARFNNGIACIDNYLLVATTKKFGECGTELYIQYESGYAINAIIADGKNETDDPDCNEWGHLYGRCIVEFEVDRDTWLANGHPGAPTWFPEICTSRVVRITSLGQRY